MNDKHDKHITPKVTVDIVIRHLPTNRLILITRKNEPLGIALPGGFVDVGETTMAAAIREAYEEVQVRISNVKQFHTYSEPGRDPRGHGITVVYTADTMELPEAADDAKSIVWLDGWETKIDDRIEQQWQAAEIATLKKQKLCFDHAQIIMDVKRYQKTGERPTRE